ncbi:hypothetical protein BGZ63DRAFT_361943 [Mariannaea sp. PMI_226]|nr:hypothetical protein BGZ63DRAFT_361943 [Mariannaea sp. PMI_226]
MKNISSAACGAPVRSSSQSLRNTLIVLSVIPLVPLIQRFVSKIWDKLTLGLDDWFALITALAMEAENIIILAYVIPSGLGKDMWTLQPQQIYNFIYYFYIATVFYIIQITAIRLSILFFYLRIFPSQNSRRVIWATISTVSLFGFIILIISIIPCWPISYTWTRWDAEHKGRCVNINLLAWILGLITIAFSVIILAIPLWQLKTLNLKRSRKVGVALMFIIGTFDTVVSIIRLKSLTGFFHSSNLTWDEVEIAKWSAIEISVGVICICIPTTRLFLAKCCSRFGSTAPAYYQQNEPENSNYGGSHARTWPMQTLASGPKETDSHRPTHWQVDTGKSHHGDTIHASPDQTLKPKHGILHTTSFVATYGEADEQELISHGSHGNTTGSVVSQEHRV